MQRVATFARIGADVARGDPSPLALGNSNPELFSFSRVTSLLRRVQIAVMLLKHPKGRLTRTQSQVTAPRLMNHPRHLVHQLLHRNLELLVTDVITLHRNHLHGIQALGQRNRPARKHTLVLHQIVAVLVGGAHDEPIDPTRRIDRAAHNGRTKAQASQVRRQHALPTNAGLNEPHQLPLVVVQALAHCRARWKHGKTGCAHEEGVAP